MIKIYYLNTEIEGEPPPNVYLRGKPEDFHKLLVDLYVLGCGNNQHIKTKDLAYFDPSCFVHFHFTSSQNGVVLLARRDDELLMDLAPIHWRTLLHIIMSVSFEASHNYIELEGGNFMQEANIIISSEG